MLLYIFHYCLTTYLALKREILLYEVRFSNFKLKNFSQKEIKHKNDVQKKIISMSHNFFFFFEHYNNYSNMKEHDRRYDSNSRPDNIRAY